MRTRTRARAVALQVLYETDIAEQHLPGEVLKLRLEDEPLTNDLAGFSSQIVFGVRRYALELDQLISRYAPEWPLDQIAAIDRNIMRMAFWEFAVERCTPVKVAINEAVELAKLYGSDSAPRFINGVLGTLVDHEAEIHEIIKEKILQEGELNS